MTTAIQQKMTRQEFNQLSFNDKLKVVWKFGKVIDNHITSFGDIIISNIHSLFQFHVEVVYDQHAAGVKEIISYKAGGKMVKYLPQ